MSHLIYYLIQRRERREQGRRSWGCSTHANQSLYTNLFNHPLVSQVTNCFVKLKKAKAYHPIAALIRSVCQNIKMDILGSLVVPALYCLRQFYHVGNRVRLDKVLVVEMVKQNV
jgi:hypothetical protein